MCLRRLEILFLVLVLPWATGHFLTEAVGVNFVATAHQDHVWFIMKSSQGDKKGVDLCHHALDLGWPFFKQQSWLGQAPVAMASWKNRVWVVFSPKPGSGAPYREVFTLQVQKNPAFDMYDS